MRSPCASCTTAERRPMVAMVPLSWYWNGSVGSPRSRWTICSAACLPSWIAGCASCGDGFFSSSAMSPAAKIRSVPCTRRSGLDEQAAALALGQAPGGDRLVRGHPRRPDGEVAAQRGPVAPAPRCPGSPRGCSVFTRMSTPRSTSCRLVYSRSFGWNGISSSGAISTSRMCIRSGSTSGNVARSTVLRSSPRVPASSTPVAPPPTMVTANSRLPVRVGAEPLEAVHDVVAQHDRVGPGVEAEGVLLGSLRPEVVGRHPGGQDQVVVADLPAARPAAPPGRPGRSRRARRGCSGRGAWW